MFTPVAAEVQTVLPLRLATASLIAVALFASAALASPKTDKTKERLARGDIIVNPRAVKGSDYPRVTVLAVIDAPPARVWEIIEDCNNYHRHLPRVVRSKEISRKGDVVRCHLQIDVPLLSDYSEVTEARHTVVPGKKYVRAYHLVESADFEKDDGSWTLVPFEGPDRTMVVYDVHAVPTVAVPAALQRAVMHKNMRLLIARLRSAVAPH